jgi:two-component system phosphate regulon sensor histidine kinase PhoR
VECELLALFAEDVFRGTAQGALTERLTDFGRQTGMRATLIDPSGVVVADSAADAARMENHLSRAEVQEALRAGVGSARRQSVTVRQDLLYYARAVRVGGELLGFARVAVPLDSIHSRVDHIRRRILLGAVVGVLVAVLVGLLVARSITAPIVEMTRTARDLRAGRYESRMSHIPRDELGVLGDALNQLGGEITSRIAAISTEEARLRAMLAGMVEGVVAVDDEDHLVFSNRAARDSLGIENAIEGNPRLWELARRAELDELIREARETHSAARRELSFRRGGRELVLSAQANRFEAGRTSGVVVVFEDITGLRRLERIRRDFVANVSHELKTPLTSIRGYVETLLSGAIHDPDNNERFLGKIQANVSRLQHLVTDLLSLARIEDQESSLHLVPVQWKPLIPQAARRHEEVAMDKGVKLSIERGSDDVHVLGDSESLTQVLDNLVDNAIKYTPRGGVVSLRLGVEQGRGVLEVRDTGLGIPASDLERIFERFYRVDKARSRDVGGTGLGLAIVKHLVHAMGGVVDVESEPGRGSAFRVRLALA